MTNSLWRKRQEPEALKRITRDNTEHDRHYYLADEVDALLAQPEPYDQTALELCNVCGWKTLIPDDACLNCERAQPQQEPVAWMREDEDCSDCIVWQQTEEHTIPLYTTPPQRTWVGLTDEELPPLVGDNGKYMELQQVRRFYKYIEAKLKEKNSA